ncbi:MAG TPA: aminopeptidase P family protein [Candidatus Eisenbacteria bacterium]|nr:aminopeptidase P family protein [Candidatus Eisenbacteria bacterium]
MIRSQTIGDRQRKLRAAIREPIVLMGHTQLPRNYPANTWPFRQDSTFLYYTGCNVPGAVAVFTEEAGFELYVPEAHEDDELWHGPVPGPDALRERCGADRVLGRSGAAERIRKLSANGGRVHTVAVCEPIALGELRSWTGLHLVPGAPDAASGGGSEALMDQIISQRILLSSEELDEMRTALAVTRRAHAAARELSRPGVTEQQIASEVARIFIEAGHTEAYNSIITVRGEILHCHDYPNTLRDGQLLLIDAGSEAPSGYASDITRAFPVSGTFDAFQRDVYAVVLRAQEAAIDRCRAGERYRDVHLEACRVIAEGLVELGLLRGKPEELVELGAHALFFPHGIGHLIGLDVHDMEGYGDRAGYAPGRQRSEQFGLAYLRLDRDLQPGMVVTIEPGLYFVPAILHRKSFRERFAGVVNFERAERHLGFGGIRIEDDVTVTSGAPEVLSASIPKSIAEVERRA